MKKRLISLALALALCLGLTLPALAAAFARPVLFSAHYSDIPEGHWCEKSVERAAALENYVYVWSVKGDGWLRPFRNNPKGLREERREVYAQALEELEETRQALMAPLARLKEQLEAGTGESFARGVYGFFQDHGTRDLTIKLYPGGRHEMLNEINKGEVYADVLDWLEQRIERVRP